MLPACLTLQPSIWRAPRLATSNYRPLVTSSRPSRPRSRWCPSAGSASEHDDAEDKAERAMRTLESMDLNQLQTALNVAIAAEDYARAAKIRDVLALAVDASVPSGPADWMHLGLLDWLAHRAEDLGFRIPTEVQRRATPVIVEGSDCIIESETGSGKTLAFLLPALSRLEYPPDMYPDDLKGPQLVIVVPTRELGVQITMLTYKLLGGSVNPGIPGERANMFRYQGPRGIKVRGLLMEGEVDLAAKDRYLQGVHVLVGTPDLLAAALDRGVHAVQHCETIVVDEVDACLGQKAAVLERIMQAALQRRTPAKGSSSSQRPSVVLAGATLEDSLVQVAVEMGWLEDPVRISVGRRMRMPSGLRHRCIVVDAGSKVAALARQLRADLKTASPDEAPARVMLFANGEQQAVALADPLRTSLWGDHTISVLLPGGVEPIKALHSFRDNKSTLLLATPEAARGLDLPAVSHVYNISPPFDAADYLHRAGRAGRIGAPVTGVVTTLATEQEFEEMIRIAHALNVEIERVEPLAAPRLAEDGADVEDLEEMKKNLEALLPAEESGE